MLKKKVAAMVLVLSMALGLSACGNGKTAEETGTAASTGTVKESTGGAEDLADAPEGWPSATINLIVGFNPGGDTDLNNRMMAQYMEKRLGTSIAVTNLGGSNGSVALTQYKEGPTDGCTIIGVNTSAVTNNEAVGLIDFSYDAYEVVGVYGRSAGELLIASKDSGITSMEDLAEKAEAAPGTITMGVAFGGATHSYGILLKNAGIDCNIVDGGDGANRIASLVGNHVDVCFVPYQNAKEYIETGAVIPLCTMGDSCSALPDVPSITENDYVEHSLNNSYVWLMPKGTDPAVVEYVAGLMTDIVTNDAEYAEAQEAINYNEPVIWTGQEALDYLKELRDIAFLNASVLQ